MAWVWKLIVHWVVLEFGEYKMVLLKGNSKKMIRNDIRGRDQEDKQQKNKIKLLCRFGAFLNGNGLFPPCLPIGL